MKRLILALVVVGALAAPAGRALASGFCDESEGCSPCPPPSITISKEGVEITWIYC